MRVSRTGIAFLTVVVLALGGTGCTEEDEEKAGDIFASATAAAASKLNEVKEGVNAKEDVKAGAVEEDGDRSTAEITATNSTGRTADYTVLVNFKDADGDLLDVVVLTINDVQAGASKSGTARSNRPLSGVATAEVGQALRH